jgi:hypothetical protein
MLEPVTYTIESGYMVGRAPWLDEPVRTSLRRCARELAANGDTACGALDDEHWAAMEGFNPDAVSVSGMDVDTEIAGRIWRKIKKKVKKGAKKVGKVAVKAVKKTVEIAHKVTHNKAFEKIHKGIQNMVPEPFKIFVKVHNKLAGQTHKYIDKFTKGDKKATAIAPAIKAVAEGKLDVKELEAQAKQLGIDADEVKGVAALSRLKLQASAGNRTAQATVKALNVLAEAQKGAPKAAQKIIAQGEVAKAFPGATQFAVKSSKGKAYRTIVIPL